MTLNRTTYRRLLLLCVILPGVCGVIIFGFYALVDWKELQKAYIHFASVTKANADLPQLFVAEARQNIHRINLFADGVWCLLSGIMAAIGLHGLTTTSNENV